MEELIIWFSVGWGQAFADVSRQFRTRRVVAEELIERIALEFPQYPRSVIARIVRKCLS